ncbi:MAG: helicase C-terminal domain-containing protein, partial [Lysinibacillus sp.]
YKGARAYIVDDMPDIQSVSQQDYIEAVAAAIVQTVRAVEGRSFVLFTSHQMLKETVELLTDSQLLNDYMLFAQGVTGGSRMKLLKAFQKFHKSILFGTNSFWEGVDVPGDGLTSVIVVRLPFTSPDEPTFKAKSHILQSQGINAFEKLSLPEAILRFKQGFGRLIRSSTDRGAFIVLDRRIEKKSYGAEFIAALPNISVQKLPLGDMVLQLEHWYNNE